MDAIEPALRVFMRFLHISSIVVLIGSAAYGALVLNPVLNALPEEARSTASANAQNRFRNLMYLLLVFVLGSGVYNLLSGPTHTSTWQMMFGIKMLFVLHILASAVLWAGSPHGDIAVKAKGKRRLAGLAISGLVVILLSSVLRTMTQRGM
jgi:hypothetical protein